MKYLLGFGAFLLALATLAIFSPASENEKNIPAWFKGKIGRSYKDSTPYWEPLIQAPQDAPNILFIVLDDVGFGHISSFGGEIQTR